MNKYTQLNENERILIDHLFNKEKFSICEIANKLKRNKSTISREIKRNTINGIYNFQHAQHKYKSRQWHKHMFYLEKYSEFTNYFLKYFDKNFYGVKATINKIKSIDESIKIPCFKQIYNWIKSRRWELKPSDKLRSRRKNGNRKRTLGIFSKFTDRYVFPIWLRPKYIDLRRELDHYEIDFVIGKKSSGYDNLITITDRLSRKTFITKIKSKNPMKTNSAIYKVFKENNVKPKSITIDNGLEFQKIGILASWLRCKVYYCEPYASYQRGSNENVNGLIRRQYKKGTDFNLITDEEIIRLQDKINSMPREMFNWLSSDDVYKIKKNRTTL